MDIRQLRYFLRVAELRSFTRAAEELHIAQPALSRQVKLLEEEFGLRLLHRHGRGVVLTDAGAELMTRSVSLVSAFDRLTCDMQVRAGGAAPRGAMTLGVPISLSRLVTMPILARCRADFPGVALRIVEGHSEMVADWLISGRVELAILFGDNPRRAIAAQPIAREQIGVIAGVGSPWAGRAAFTAMDLVATPIALPRRPHATWAMLDAAGIHPRHVIEADTLLEMLQHVHEGSGVTLLGLSSVTEEVGAGKVRALPIEGAGLSRTLVLAHATGHGLPTVAEAIAPSIRAKVAELVGAAAY